MQLKGLSECTPVEAALWKLVFASQALVNLLPSSLSQVENVITKIDEALPFITRKESPNTTPTPTDGPSTFPMSGKNG